MRGPHVGGPQILVPFHRAEAITVAQAAVVANKTTRTIRGWCMSHDIARRISGQWNVSRVALAMFLDGDRAAHKSYLCGDRSSPAVVSYFHRCGVPLTTRGSVAA